MEGFFFRFSLKMIQGTVEFGVIFLIEQQSLKKKKKLLYEEKYFIFLIKAKVDFL
jgi:hypothetical protein